MNTNSDAPERLAVDAPAAATTIAAAGGTVVGRAHRRAGRGGQDAFAWRSAAGGAAMVAAVCDGCGSGAASEVGAALGAQLWTAALAALLDAGAAVADAATWHAARDRVRAQLAALVDAMGGDRDAARRARLVHDHFLFTSVLAAWTPTHAAVAAIGDGVYAFDDDARTLGPFADDAPPYLGHALLAADATDDGAAPGPAFNALDVRAAGAVRALLIASDGAAAFLDAGAAHRDAAGAPIGDLAQFTRDPRWFRNPDALRRRLAVVNREEQRLDHARGAIVRRGGPLDDDTTIVILRRDARPAPGAPATRDGDAAAGAAP